MMRRQLGKNLTAIRNLPMILIIGFLASSCVSTTKNASGLYQYSYCLKTCVKSQIDIKREVIQNTICDIEGVVWDKEDNKKTLPGVSIGYKTDNSRIINGTVSDADGKFVFKVPSGNFKIIISAGNFTSIEQNISLQNEKLFLTIYLGVNDYTVYAVESKRKLMKWEIKRRAIRLSKKPNALQEI